MAVEQIKATETEISIFQFIIKGVEHLDEDISEPFHTLKIRKGKQY